MTTTLTAPATHLIDTDDMREAFYEALLNELPGALEIGLCDVRCTCNEVLYELDGTLAITTALINEIDDLALDHFASPDCGAPGHWDD
ncbi:hypothetical protein HNR23_002301 [Nocardiopsis mwathae]|uniref:Uncharacterized protein n=1 Tax=Nocardiopsis mwathae TaxID=1472723 RepID=A0A7W9YJB0_9ACTN|nr:hypothetical protein [Nocardiopsis mwathae]MBB6172241.1 hypothetical protein [Nocardiopsis mwathae]